MHQIRKSWYTVIKRNMGLEFTDIFLLFHQTSLHLQTMFLLFRDTFRQHRICWMTQWHFSFVKVYICKSNTSRYSVNSSPEISTGSVQVSRCLQAIMKSLQYPEQKIIGLEIYWYLYSVALGEVGMEIIYQVSTLQQVGLRLPCVVFMAPPFPFNQEMRLLIPCVL